jgi:C1A family cysteine protease
MPNDIAMGLPGTGWIPDLPDKRDYTATSPKINTLLGKMGLAAIDKVKLPTQVDLRSLFPPAFQQGSTNSCTAQAAAALVSYFEHAAFQKFSVPSRLFIYKTTRNLLYQTSDNGAFIRSTIGALTLFGAPPETYWPFALQNINTEPPAFCYAFGEKFQTLSYYRYEEAGQSTEVTLQRIKANLAAKLPSMFGFYLFSSVATALSSGHIPYPSSDERPVGGHAVVAVGYDDEVIISHPSTKKETKGAILIRNSWGEEWGVRGYGWLPYDYVLGELATDWWSILLAEWVDTEPFAVDDPRRKGKSARDTG